MSIRDPHSPLAARGQYTTVQTPSALQPLAASLRRLWQSRALRVSVAVFAALRLVTLLAALLMARDLPDRLPNLMWYDPESRAGNPSAMTYFDALPVDAPLSEWMAPWRRYDTTWYILIAMQGYSDDSRIVFPPLYPALIATVAPLTGGNVVLAAVLVSNSFCLLAFVLLYRLVARQFGDSIATRTLILLAAFPTGFYLVAGYTEPLFLAFTLGAFTAALDRRWWLAGALAFLAALTRLQGAALVLPLSTIAYFQHRPTSLGDALRRLPAVVGAPLGTLAYTQYIAFSNLGSMDRAYALSWKLDTRMPWEAIQTYFERWQAGIVPQHEHNNAFALLVMLLLGIVVLWRMRKADALYVYAMLCIILLRYHFGEGLEGAQFESAFRYVLVLFPCFAAAALLLKWRWAFVLVVLVMLQWQLFLLDNFIHWRWVA